MTAHYKTRQNPPSMVKSNPCKRSHIPKHDQSTTKARPKHDQIRAAWYNAILGDSHTSTNIITSTPTNEAGVDILGDETLVIK